LRNTYPKPDIRSIPPDSNPVFLADDAYPDSAAADTYRDSACPHAYRNAAVVYSRSHPNGCTHRASGGPISQPLDSDASSDR
jgi:hypothetical protein